MIQQEVFPILQTEIVVSCQKALKQRRVALGSKRFLDIVVSFILLVVLLPVSLLLMLWIWIQDHHDPIFRQTRVTQYGRTFTMYKFRTMYATHKGPQLTISNDSRLLPHCSWMRCLRLDELPQLWNVLRGDMSLVGTRPEVPEFVAQYTPEMYLTLLLPAGIASPASLTYAKENELLAGQTDPKQYYCEKILPEKLQLDYGRIQNFQLTTDIRVLLRAIKLVLGKRALQMISLLFTVILSFVGLVGTICVDPAPVLIACVLLWLDNIRWAIFEIKKLSFFLIFNITMFLFLLGRPLIDFIRGTTIGRGLGFDAQALFIIFVGLCGLRAGALVAKRFPIITSRMTHLRPKNDQCAAFRFACVLIFWIAWIFRMAMNIEILLYMQRRTYTEYYLFHSNFPFFISTIARFSPVALCGYLSTLPSKKNSVILLILNIVKAMPLLLIGARENFVVSVLFAFCYFLIRQAARPDEHWFGKREYCICIVGIPAFLLGLGAINYIRGSDSQQISHLLSIDFLYKQGVTFNVVSDTVNFLPQIREKGVGYSIAPLTEYFMHGTIAQKLWGASAITSPLQSKVFSNVISYYTFGEELFLQGHGAGGCYLCELFADFSWTGTFLGSVLIGAFWVYDYMAGQHGGLFGAVALLMLEPAYMMPRASFCAPLTSLLTMGTLCCAVVILIMTKIITNNRFLSRMVERATL